MAAAALLGLTDFQHSPLLSNAVPCALAAGALQAAVGLASTFLVSPPTERYFDLSGAVTNVTVAVLSLYLPRWRAAAAGPVGALSGPNTPHWRQTALTDAVVIWATRLGTYLFRRILREGKDARFDSARSSLSMMFVAWFAQALWIVLIQSPVTAVNAVSAVGTKPALFSPLPDAVLWSDVVGFGLFVFGLAFESVADWQKAQWQIAKAAKQHDEVFMARGLFSKCRYPHYFGETTLWTGLAVAAAGVLVRGGVRAALGDISTVTALAIAAVSPAFTAFSLLKVTGVPLSEPKYDGLYGHRADYQAWKRETPRFFPKLF